MMHAHFHFRSHFGLKLLSQLRPWAPSYMGKRGSLLEAAFKGEKSKQARATREHSVNRAVQKILVDNFKHFSDAEIDGIQVDGLTLRQRLTRDRELKAKPSDNVVMGARYYKEIKQLYSSSTNPVKLLVVTDDSSPGKEVFDAMLAAKRHPCNRQPLIQYLITADTPNMSEVMGIFKWCLELNPAASAEQLRGVLEVMRWVRRLELDDTYETQLAHLKDKFNEALVHAGGSVFCVFVSVCCAVLF